MSKLLEKYKSVLIEDAEADNNNMLKKGKRKVINIYEPLKGKLFDANGLPTYQTQVAILHAIGIVTEMTNTFNAKEMFLEDGETLMKWPPYQYINARFEGYMDEVFNFNAKCGKFEGREKIIKKILDL